jgi:hypothetical protein
MAGPYDLGGPVRRFTVSLILVCLFSFFAVADQPPVAPNSNPTYRRLRDIAIGSETLSVNNFVLKRDAATFTFHQGTFSFLTPVNGKVTGAIFIGEGEMHLVPPIPAEQKSLSILTKSNEPGMTETFRALVLRFTDNTYDEIKKAGTAASPAGNAQDVLHQSQINARNHLRTNYDARILQDVLSSQPGGFFLAFIDGRNYSGKLLFCIDPHGAEYVAPEEVSLRTYDDAKYGIWAAFHLAPEYSSGKAGSTQENSAFDIENQDLDTRIEKSGYLRGNALTTIVSRSNDLRAVGFDLFPKLRVQKVTDAAGIPLDFVQEDKDHDADYWVILPKGLASGEKLQIRTIYEGKDAVESTGSGNYFPVAREDWYPADRFGRYTNYQLKFSVPKKVKVVATGALVSETTDGDNVTSIWKGEAPMAVAGFNLGEFKRMEAKVEKYDYVVESYANVTPPDFVQGLQHIAGGEGESLSENTRGQSQSSGLALGSMDTTGMMKKPLAEAQVSMAVYTNYFGPIPYKRVAMTQQTACTFGQSWPNLIYLPICSFFDSTVRHQLGLDDVRGYWKTVAPHEIAHQWWGHTVGFNTYRDQWMSEGFAEFSASLFVQSISSNNDEFRQIWKDQLELITQKNKEGFRPIDVGPLTEGVRLVNTRSGTDVYRRLIYPKGAFVLHMIRMMMHDSKTKDQAFKDMMHDFVQTYRDRAASTEDFKAIVEKHMTPAMDLDGNRKMDWFFNEYVYGTALPDYKFESTIGSGENGVYVVKFKLTQSNVNDSFSMLVPVYLELANGGLIQLGSATMKGNRTLEQTIPLTGLTQKPKRAILNYYYDVLATGY